MLNNEVEKIFDDAFCDVTKKLIKLELHKVRSDDEKSGQFFQEGYREVIEIYGYMNARIICWFSDELFHYIIDMMNKGKTPPEDEIPLFLNEYINITCGRAVSRVSNLSGHSSRLSIPSFYQGKEVVEEKGTVKSGMYLAYRTKMGKLHIFMNYSFKGEQEEVV